MPRRRRSRTAVVDAAPAWLTRKISETLLDYMGPVVNALPEMPPAKELHSLVQIAVTVWNAVVVDDLHGSQHVAEARKLIVKGLPADGRALMLSVFDSFVHVKREAFADDPRMVASFEVLVDGPEQIRLRAAATVLPPKP